MFILCFKRLELESYKKLNVGLNIFFPGYEELQGDPLNIGGKFSIRVHFCYIHKWQKCTDVLFCTPMFKGQSCNLNYSPDSIPKHLEPCVWNTDILVLNIVITVSSVTIIWFV